ncbi:proline dehydrogenase [Actinomadura sp. BRA 177]|uniref:proline dehydrogenase n=1 Tax=Actinomadura sp. BRA 177 TaxID=2745202 RepID=UPI001595062C|nr:proline dehydrogenase [Actinomadura sp. BRA 177]NVI93031.1 proline dehydrogenase [Actinomadura sp. BRA 177]
MDAGIAALLGAGLGSLTTIGAAVVTGRAQARTQFAQWRRQHRRDAYAAYLGALHERDIAMDAVLAALRPDEPDLADVDEKVRRFIDLAREVHRAMEIVIIEGPPPMVEAAERVQRASEGLSAVMRRMVEDARAADSGRKVADEEAAAERERLLYAEVKAFRAEARDVLGRAQGRRGVTRPDS